MRVSRSLPVALFYATLVSSSTLVEQVTGWPWPWPHQPRTTTIIDLLSTNEEFGPLLKVLQRTALIPLLNTAPNITLIAPIAAAFDDDNIDVTRRLMMYHTLNASVLSSMIEGEIVFESLLRMDERDNSSLGVGVRVERQGDSGRGQGALRIGGTARVVKSDWVANNGIPSRCGDVLRLGVIQVVDRLIQIPESIESNLDKMKSASTFNTLFKDTSFPREYSLFVPDDSSFDILHPVEISYLKTKFGEQDRTALLHRHTSEEILYRKNFQERGNATGGNTTSLEGEKINFTTNNSQIRIDNATLTHPDIVCNNGVIHQISQLLIPASVTFTPLKYLYGLHDYIFAETVKASDYAHLANDSSAHQTIFASVDKAYANSLEKAGLLKQIRYNFVDRQIELPSTEADILFETMYTLASLDGAGQMLKLSKRGERYLLNNEVELLPKKVESGNTLIYEIAEKLSPPGPLRPTALQGLSLFRSFHHLVATNLDQRVLFDETAITVLLPVDRAWKQLGLTEKYLLSDAAGEALCKVMLSSILKGVHYFKDFSSKTKQYTSLSGEKVRLHMEQGQLVFDDLGISVSMDERDILAANGVGHSLSSVPIPPSVKITPENLINATDSTEWLEILHKNNLMHVVSPSSNHTLLIPTDKAVRSSPVNPSLFISHHIIPPQQNGSPQPDLLSLSSSERIHTLSGTRFQISQDYPDIYTLKMEGTNQTARVLDAGKTSTGAQVLLIDAVLWEVVPPGRWNWARPVAVIIFAVAVCVVSVSGVRWAVRWWQRRREEKPLFVDQSVGEEEEEPLINGSV